MIITHTKHILSFPREEVATAITKDRYVMYTTGEQKLLTCAECDVIPAQCLLCGWIGHFPQMLYMFRGHRIRVCTPCIRASVTQREAAMATVFARILKGDHWMFCEQTAPGAQNWLGLLQSDGSLIPAIPHTYDSLSTEPWK